MSGRCKTATVLGWCAAVAVLAAAGDGQTPATMPSTQPGFVVVPAGVFKDPNGEKAGLLMGIFDGQDFQNRVVNKMVPLLNMAAKDGDAADPDSTLTSDYGIKWMGQIVPPVSGDYTLEIQSSGGVVMYAGDETVIDALNEKGPQDRHGVTHLEAGKATMIEIDFLQVSGPAKCELLWKTPDGAGK